MTTRSTRLVTVPAIVLALALTSAGCSGDDEDPPKDDGTPTTPGGTAETIPPGSTETPDPAGMTVTRGCRATVAVRGDVTISWKGKGEVRIQDVEFDADAPGAVFSAAKGDTRLVAYSSGPTFTPSISLSADGKTYADPPAKGSKINKLGLGATIDQPLVSNDGRVVVDARITCPDPDKKPKKGNKNKKKN